MNFPSIKHLSEEAFKSAKRFPLTLLSALISVIVAIYLIENEQEIKEKLPLINLQLTSTLGLVLFFCISIYHEKGQRSKLPLWVLNIIGGGILALIYFSLPSSEGTSNISQPYIRYTIYNIVIHLMVSFAPFISKGEINGFWQYNKMLFLRFCLSILYSGFVYMGLTLALVALNLLFDADIEGETFFELFIIVIGLFNTWFFVSGIDPDLKSLDSQTDYPKGLKVFTQYVLLPLLIIYLTILYAYVAKIIGLWDWPKGIVSYLIVCVAVLGILAFLLIYPFGKNEEKHWISKFSKLYYYLLFPLILVLFFAIGIRIGDYGLTVNRYIILELGVWLAFISGYFIFGKKSIKMIPMSLAGLILMTSFGPWGMFSTSGNSQVKRLEKILVEHKILVDGKIQNEPVVIEIGDKLKLENRRDNLLSDSLHNEVYSILNYLDDFHGFNKIDVWYKQNPDTVRAALEDSTHNSHYYNDAELRMKLFGLKYKYNYDVGSVFRYYNIEQDNLRIVKTSGTDYILDVNYYKYNFFEDEKKRIYNSEEHTFYFTKNDNYLFFLINESSDTLRFDIDKLLKKIAKKYPDNTNPILQNSEMLLSDTVEGFSAKLQLETLQIEEKDTILINNFEGKIFVKMD